MALQLRATGHLLLAVTNDKFTDCKRLPLKKKCFFGVGSQMHRCFSCFKSAFAHVAVSSLVFWEANDQSNS